MPLPLSFSNVDKSSDIASKIVSSVYSSPREALLHSPPGIRHSGQVQELKISNGQLQPTNSMSRNQVSGKRRNISIWSQKQL